MDSYKILTQYVPTTSWAEVYVVPEPAAVEVGTGVEVAPKAVSLNTQTLVTSIIVCGYATGSYSIALKSTSGGSDPVEPLNLLFHEKAITANTTDVLSPGLTLGPGNSLWVKETTSGTHVGITIMGIEIT